MSYIARQPNGLLCRLSSIVDQITDYNMTDEDYIELCAERGKEEARDVLEHHVHPFSYLGAEHNKGLREQLAEIRDEMEKPKEQCEAVHLP